MTTYALFTKQEDGSMFRVGTVSVKKGNSVRIVSAQIKEQKPGLDLSICSVKVRRNIGNGVEDFGDFVRLDPNC